MKSNLPFAFVVLLLQGCSFINPPIAPQEDNELLKECAWYSYETTKLLVEQIQEGQFQNANTTALQLAISTESMKEYVGHPQKQFNGDIKQLANKMIKAEANYEHDLIKWQSRLANYTEWEVTKTRIADWFSSWGAILFICLIMGVVLIIRK